MKAWILGVASRFFNRPGRYAGARMARTSKNKVATCSECGRRRVVGRCGDRRKGDHCRSCCTTRRRHWKPSLIASVVRIVKKRNT